MSKLGRPNFTEDTCVNGANIIITGELLKFQLGDILRPMSRPMYSDAHVCNKTYLCNFKHNCSSSSLATIYTSTI